MGRTAISRLASKAARARWANVDKAERSRVMARARRGLKYKAAVSDCAATDEQKDKKTVDMRACRADTVCERGMGPVAHVNRKGGNR